VVDNTPNVTGPANAPQAAGKIIEDSVAAQNWDVEPNSPPPGWLTTSPLSSIGPPAAPPSGNGTAPSSTTLEEPKRVHTLTIQRGANDPKGQPIDVTSSARAPDAAATPEGTRDSLDPQQLDKAPSAPLTTGGYVVQV
jgi:hypothetical protein